MTKYNIGDKVTIRDDLVAVDYFRAPAAHLKSFYRMENNTIGAYFVLGMGKYLGKEGVIVGTKDGRYVINLDDRDYVWTDEMFVSDPDLL